MAPWGWRLALRRARVQAPLLAVVLLVSVVSATLLATLYLLDRATTTFATRSSLDAAPAADLALVHTVTVAGPVDQVVEASGRAAAASLGDTPTSSSVYVEGAISVVPLERGYVLGYLGTSDHLERIAALTDGSWPSHGGASPDVVVPQSMADRLGVRVGDTLDLQDTTYAEEATTVRVVGVYLPIEPGSDAWHGDLFSGDGYSPAVAVPGAGGRVSAPAYGPLLTTLDGVEARPVAQAAISYLPDFSTTSIDALRGIATRLDTAEMDLQRQEGQLAKRVAVADPVAATVGRVIGSTSMTRSAVLVTGLLLLIVTAAAIVQAARLVAERRHDERHLMAARGASTRQSFRLGTLEAVAMAAATVAAAAPLARLAYLRLARVPLLADAGLDRDPGLPLGAWVAGGVVAAVLVAIVLAPLTRRAGSLVEAEADRARPGRRAAFQRAGVDVAVLAAAGIAFWQLRMYHSPVVAGEEAPRLDPVLAAGPALALLAGALLAARVVPLAARLMEFLAAGARRAVTPLASWEVARRPVRALSAVLLLTLSLSVSTFAAGFLATWSQSQRDQALYRHPVDAVASADSAGWMQRSRLVTVADTSPQPVARDAIDVSNQTTTELTVGRQRFSGVYAQLVATTNDAWAMLGGGRLDEVRGDRLALALRTAPDTYAAGIAIPAGAQDLALTMSATTPVKGLDDVLVGVRALVRSASGEYATVDLGVAPADGDAHRLHGPLGDSVAGATVEGLQVLLASTGTADLSREAIALDHVRVRVDLTGIGGTTDVPWWSIDDAPAPVTSTPVDASAASDWTPVATSGVVDDVAGDADAVSLTVASSLRVLQNESLVGIITAAPLTGDVPVVATDALVRDGRLRVGDDATLRIGSTDVRAHVVAAVPQVPGVPGKVAAAPLEAVQIATFQAGGLTRDVVEYWVATDDARAYAAAVPAGVDVTTRVGVVDELTRDPLRVAITVAMWAVVGAAALLAALGFAVHLIVSTRSRALELAQLRAVGLSTGATVRMLGVETTLLAALGTVGGLGLGLGLISLAAPLVSFGPDGRPPVPDVLVVVPWPLVAALALEAVAVVGVALVIAAALVRRIRPADLLRQGEAR